MQGGRNSRGAEPVKFLPTIPEVSSRMHQYCVEEKTLISYDASGRLNNSHCDRAGWLYSTYNTLSHWVCPAALAHCVVPGGHP